MLPPYVVQIQPLAFGEFCTSHNVERTGNAAMHWSDRITSDGNTAPIVRIAGFADLNSAMKAV